MTILESFVIAMVRILDAGLRRTRHRAGAVLVYHGIGRYRQGSLSPQVPAALFAAHLAFLRRQFRVVPAEDILCAVARRIPGEPFPVAVTFDDDLASHVHAALPVIVEAGVPATFFVSGDSAGYWWQRLERAFDLALPLDDILGALDINPVDLGGDMTVHGVARVMHTKTPGSMAVAKARLRDLVRDTDEGPPQALTTDAVRMLAQSGMTVGFHTLHHDLLPTLDNEALVGALTDGRAGLETLCGQAIRSIAYPHGQADDRVAEGARRAGYTLGFTTDAKRLTPRTDPLRIGRLYPSPRSTSRLALRILWSLISPAARPEPS